MAKPSPKKATTKRKRLAPKSNWGWACKCGDGVVLPSTFQHQYRKPCEKLRGGKWVRAKVVEVE